jgi:hypothetical protein
VLQVPNWKDIENARQNRRLVEDSASELVHLPRSDLLVVDALEMNVAVRLELAKGTSQR